MGLRLSIGFCTVTAMLLLVSCATQPTRELVNHVALSLRAHTTQNQFVGNRPSESATPLSTVDQVGDEKIERDYWPNGNPKTEWRTTPSFIIHSEFHENGVKSNRWLAYNNGIGPGHVKSMERWDTDGVQCYSTSTTSSTSTT
ncbi:hypothetical protein PLCT2_00869 [Planctomycetaceae bacterium]|nr:hypothetical protein PLCT2_00869 [Planctomycetaceae bacterium]